MPLLRAKTKKQLLQDLSARAARLTGVPERDIFDVLLQRERLGSTGLGHGVATPHAKLQGLKRIVGIFARLAEPIDFDALDGQKVDIVFLLLAPEGAGADHLKALARISRLLRDAKRGRQAPCLEGRCRALRGVDRRRAFVQRGLSRLRHIRK